MAVAANGDIYVVDGYGSQKLHRFDKNFKLIKTIGGRGKENGKFNTCHGIWVSTLKKEPEIYIADRHNDRLEVFRSTWSSSESSAACGIRAASTSTTAICTSPIWRPG